MKRRILLTGKNGQIGSELANTLPQLGDLAAFDHHGLDLCDSDQIRRAIREFKPNIIVNAAAFTNVDKAETAESESHAINAVAPGVMAEEAKRIGALLVHYSTDYVFDGTKGIPYNEDDPTNPTNVYGRTKLAGELFIQQAGCAHLILRTAWIYALSGRNFLLTVLRLATEREELRIVRDQIGAPTWSREIALATTAVLAKLPGRNQDSYLDVKGIYHMTAGGEASWYEFAQAILEESSRPAPGGPWFTRATGGRPLLVKSIKGITSAEYETAARRPAYSVLSNQSLFAAFAVRLPAWRAQLQHAFTGAPQDGHAPTVTADSVHLG
jgi:dTDP-4-dehydrorhamnose reductase